MKKMLAPSILSADFSKLSEEVLRLEKAGADIVHVDVMDGHFVPNISFGAGVMKSLAGKTRLPFDVHLMIEDPDRYAADFVCENTEYISFHAEAVKHIHRSIQNIKSLGVKAGVVLNPATPLCAIEEVLSEVDMVLLMSVNPGFGGQKFIENTLGKIERLAKLREDKYNFLIEVDGGVNMENAKALLDAGCDILVAGSSVFKGGTIEENVKKFRGIMDDFAY